MNAPVLDQNQPTPAVSDGADRAALVQQIVNGYPVEDRAMVAEAMGLDPAEVLATQPASSPAAQDAPPAAGESLESQVDAALKNTTQPAGETDAKTQPAAGKADPLAEQLAEARSQVADLQAKVNAPSEQDMREAALKSLANERAEIKKANDEDDAKLAALKEEDAEMAAKVEGTFSDMKALRAANLEAKISSRVEAMRQASEVQAREQAEVNQALFSLPELAKWRSDALAAGAGDTSKSSAMYDRAIIFDNALANDDAWKGKPTHERLAEVVRMVKAMGDGDPSSGTPSAPDATAKAVRQIADKSPAADPTPSSLSEIPGGAAPATDSLAALNSMTPGQIEDWMNRPGNRLGTAHLDFLIEQGDAADAATVA